MKVVNVFLNDMRFEEMVENLNQPNYYEMAISLLYTGTETQRRYINTCMKTLKGEERTEAIKDFIDIEIMIGRIEV